MDPTLLIVCFILLFFLLFIILYSQSGENSYTKVDDKSADAKPNTGKRRGADAEGQAKESATSGVIEPNYFYTSPDGGKRGPFEVRRLKALVACELITPETLLGTENGDKVFAGQVPGLFPDTSEQTSHSADRPSNFAQQAPAPSFGAFPTVQPGQPSPRQTISPPTRSPGTLPTAKNLNSYLQRYSVSAVAVSLLTILQSFQPSIYTVTLFFINLAVWGVCWCLLLYNLWKLIPAGIARTTPGKAIGLTMIPFLGYYWIFVSVLGLCKDMNKTLRQQGIRHRVNEVQGVIYCLSFIAQVIPGQVNPYVGILTCTISMFGVAVGIILFKSLVDGATALLETEASASRSFSTPTADDTTHAAPASSVSASPEKSAFHSAVREVIPTTASAGHCADCNAKTTNGEFLAFCLPGDVRQGKESLCPACVGKYTITCPKCGLDWRVNVEKELFDCPICELTQAIGCADITNVLYQSNAFLSRIPDGASKEDIVAVVGAIYRRGHPRHLDPMGGFLVLTRIGCYFLGPIDPDAAEMGHRDMLMPFASISAVSALSDGVHAQKSKSSRKLSHDLATVGGVAYRALRTIPLVGNAVSQSVASDDPPPKNRLTIGYKDGGRINVMFDIMDVSDKKIVETAADFRKRVMKFAPEFGVVKKAEELEPTSATSVQVEKYRVFQSNKLLGMFEDGVIREKLNRQEFRTSDFVMIPLETFLREISASDKLFPYYRDGKRLDQYTLQQVRDLHESGQTQPIDHILLPMPVFIERNPA